MTLQEISDSIDRKISRNNDFIKYTFYELRIRKNLSEADMYSFISLANTRLKNLGYKTYRTGQKYYYDYKEQIVKDNELLIAIKNKEVQNENRK